MKLEEKEIDGHECIMEIYRCPLCGKEHAELGVQEYGILRFGKEEEDEAFQIGELFVIFKEKLIEVNDE